MASTPMSMVHMNGISTVGATPSTFTATSTNAMAMANCATSFIAGVRPNDRSWAILLASSTAPRTPASTTAPRSR